MQLPKYEFHVKNRNFGQTSELICQTFRLNLKRLSKIEILVKNQNSDQKIVHFGKKI